MLKSMLPAPASVLYELPQSSDSLTPRRQFSPPCCSMVGSPQVPHQVPMGEWGRVKEWEGKGTAPASSTVFSPPACITSATGLQALPPTSCGGRPRNSQLRLIAESPVLRVWVARGGGGGVGVGDGRIEVR